MPLMEEIHKALFSALNGYSGWKQKKKQINHVMQIE
jgi:hypothetical protein